MTELNDNSPMPQRGKYLGVKMQDIPYHYLLWLLDEGKCTPEVKKYIEDNKDVLEVERKRAQRN